MIIALSILVAFVMIAGGASHLGAPANFAALVPSFLPANPVIYATGALQIVIGLLALWPRSRAFGGLAFATLCTAYLPLHLWDYFRPDPVFAPPIAATIRVVVQLFLIWAGYTLWKWSRVENV